MRRRWIPVEESPDPQARASRSTSRGRSSGNTSLAIDDFHARAERHAARRVADREKQLTAGLEDVLERVTRFGQVPVPLAHENHGPTGVACELDSRREI